MAIAVVVAALIVVFSVFNGFENLVQQLYSDFYADANISPKIGKTITLTQDQITALKKIKGVVALSLCAEEKAILVNGDYQSIVTIRGVDSSFNLVNNISNRIVRGKYDLGTNEKPSIVMGVGIESAVGADVERAIYPLTLYTPNKGDNASLGTMEGMNSFKVNPTGSFVIQQDFDNQYAFTNLAFMKYMLDLKPNEYSACEIRLDTTINNQSILKQIKAYLGDAFVVKTRYEQNQNLFAAMQIEKWVIFAVTALILMVAAFNIIGALTMLVLEKQKDIGVLKALGATEQLIQSIFLCEGVLLSVIGGIIGMVVATVICLLQLKFHLIALEGGTFVINYYPVKLLWADYLVVFATIFVIAIIAAWLPATKAGKESLSLKA